RRDGNAIRNKFSSLLRRRALPHAKSAAGASADTRSQRNGGINQNAARTDRRLQLLQQSGLPFERHGEHQQTAGRAGGRIFQPGNLSICARSLANCLCRLLRARGIARADDDGLSRARPAQREARTSRAGAADDCDGAAHADVHAIFHANFHANSATSACSKEASEETDSTGSLIFMREYFVLRSAGMRPIPRINAWKSSGLVYWPAVAPASREIFSSISVPPKSLAPACRHNCDSRRFSFTHETWILLIDPASSSRASACTLRCSASVGPERASPCW